MRMKLAGFSLMGAMGWCAITLLQHSPSTILKAQTRPIMPRLAVAPLVPPVSDKLFDDLIYNAARENHLDPWLLKAMISVESGFNPHSLSPAGACGLTQLMPATAKLFGIRNIFDPKENIDVGAHHFRNLLVRFSHNLPLSLAAYNAGEAPVEKFHGIPPYPETQWYVRRVLSVYESQKRQRDSRSWDRYDENASTVS